MNRQGLIPTAWLLLSLFVQAADDSTAELAALQSKLHGSWLGGACQGELIVKPDGTFERKHYSPGNNHLTGTWSVNWNTLPARLTMTCKESDDPDFIGRKTEVKLIQLNDRTLSYQFPDQQGTTDYRRRGSAFEQMLYGTWEGPDCVGNLILHDDGSYERLNYTPGNNRLTGRWEVRWNALPPTLVLKFETSDNPDHLPVGQVSELKLVQLEPDNMAYSLSDIPEVTHRFERHKK